MFKSFIYDTVLPIFLCLMVILVLIGAFKVGQAKYDSFAPHGTTTTVAP